MKTYAHSPQEQVVIKLVLPVASPSFNVLQGRHWSKKAWWRKQWGWMVRAERLRIGGISLPESPRKVTIERYGARRLDADNQVAGCKQLIDALVAEGFLVDDSPAHLQATYRQHVGKPYRTEVRIE